MTGTDQLEAHLGGGAFALGEARGRWRRLAATLPTVLVEVEARDGRRFTLRFDCSGYPAEPPTATLWDQVTQARLPVQEWPTGGRVSQVFNPGWVSGEAIYLPCDRRAIPGHDHWRREHPQLIWKPDMGIVQYVSAVWEVLQSHELQPRAA